MGLEELQLKIIAQSHLYETPAWGFEGATFYNACVVIETMLTSSELLNSILQLEQKLGRYRTAAVGYQPRTIDLDLLAYENSVIQQPALKIPHPLLSRYGLELIPATFPISVWFRPMVIGVKMLDSDIYLPKGTPLYYFRLYSKRSDSDFQLQQRDVPEKMVKQLNENNTLRKFTMFNAWDIIKGRVSKEGKCPFRWN